MKRIALMMLLCLCAMIARADDSRIDSILQLLDEGELVKAADIIKQCEIDDPDNVELVNAKYFYHKAQAFYIMDNEEEGQLVITDKDGNEVGTIKSQPDPVKQLVQKVMAENYENEADSVLRDGIKRFPAELSLRYMLASDMISSGQHNELLDILDDILNYSSTNDFGWKVHSMDDTKESIKENIKENIFEVTSSLYACGDSLLTDRLIDVLQKDSELFPDDARIPNLTGALYLAKNDNAKALEYFNKAHALAPRDVLITCNLALMERKAGNAGKAIQMYFDIMQDDQYSYEEQKMARDELEKMNKADSQPEPPLLHDQEEVNPEDMPTMTRYKYFFDLLPSLGEMVPPEPSSNLFLLGIDYINESLPDAVGMKSPFAKGEIKSELIETDDTSVIVMTFPEPKAMPECLYVAWIPAGDHYATYTLEKSMDFGSDNDSDTKGEYWVIGTKNSEIIHGNLGGINYRPTAAQFVEILKEKGAFEPDREPDIYMKK